jgi:hypothetical protein
MTCYREGQGWTIVTNRQPGVTTLVRCEDDAAFIRATRGLVQTQKDRPASD